jgi:hypothetical protein
VREFTHNGVTYRFDAQACYDAGALIRLPDGTLLRVGTWLETLPPIPHGFSVVPPLAFVDAEAVSNAPKPWMPH